MDAALLQRFHPEEYHRRFLAGGVRPDGRAQHQRRGARLRSGAVEAAHGSASVCLGHSAAVAGVRAEVTEAVPDSPTIGNIVATVEFPPLCSSAFRDRHKAAGATTFLSNALTDVLNSAHVLDVAQLDIKKGDLYWTLQVHVVCLNYDGNSFDLCLLAAVAALENLVLPALVDGTGASAGSLQVAQADATEVVSKETRWTPKSRPLPVTFAQLPGDMWVLDPTFGEEGLGASVSLCLVGGKWLVYHQGGGADADRFTKELMPQARASVPALTKLLDEAGEPEPEGGGDLRLTV